MTQVQQKLNEAVIEVVSRKALIEDQVKIYDSLCNTTDINNNNNNNQRIPYDDEDFNESDSLMISETNELDENGDLIRHNHHNLKPKFDEVFAKIEFLMNHKLAIDSLLSESSASSLSKVYKIAKCEPDLSELCFGHLQKDVGQHPTLHFSSVDVLDHTKFSLDTRLEDNLTFRKAERCFITFVCPDLPPTCYSNEANIHDFIQIEISGPLRSFVPIDLKEKISAQKRFVRVCFTPQVAGIHSLSIKFKGNQIAKGPFSFVVVPSEIKSSTSNQSIKPTIVKTEPQEASGDDKSAVRASLMSVADKFNANESRIQEETVLQSGTLSAGRGRLLKTTAKKQELHLNGVSVLATIPSQKRKSPLPSTPVQHISELSEMMDADDEDGSLSDITRKMKKCVYVDEANNSYHNYASPMGSLNVNTNMEYATRYQIGDFDSSASELTGGGGGGGGILSQHLRKHSTSTKGLVCLLNDKSMPPVKAEFQVKYANCSFPIGVRTCNSRNWVIVCDSGVNSIKIFDKSSGSLLSELKEDQERLFTFRRPSAVLIYDNEMYVKDDKEILVFDIDRNCRFIRKFGLKILQRPYGLAFDSQCNLVLVDANLRSPQVFVFDRVTGQVLSSKPYQPAMASFAQAGLLAGVNRDKNRILAGNLAAFEKTKIRFICCNQDSLYASDLGRSIVYKTNLSGEIQMAFGHYGRKAGEFNEPSGIFADSDGGAILVGDSKNDRLQVTNFLF